MPTIKNRNVSPADRKAWTRAHYRGVENLILPSYAPDLKTLDEAGLRRDVRQTIAHGFFATAYADLWQDLESQARALEIVCDEAGDKLLVGSLCFYMTLEENLASIKRAEQAGCTHSLVMYPPNLEPQSIDEVENYLRQIIGATHMGILLYANPLKNMLRFDASGVPLALFDKLAELPTVAGIKLTQSIDPLLAYEVCRRFDGRLAIDCVPLELMPILGRQFDIAWSGEWIAESCQSPDTPYVVDYVTLIAEKKFDEATKLYWRFYPLYQQISHMQVPKLRIGGHPWVHIKYFQWLTGGNGGLVSINHQSVEQTGVLTAEDRQAMRATFKNVGIAIHDAPDDEFITGVENAQRGIEASQFEDRPRYA